MTAHQGNGEPTFVVTTSEAVGAQFAALRQEAADLGMEQKFLEAGRQVYARLQHDPRSFGEPQYRLGGLHLMIYKAAVAPLVVSYAVHNERSLVFIRWFKLLT